MKRIASLLITLSCATSSVAITSAYAADSDLLIPIDSRIKVLTYDESDVYTINTKYGYQTNIVFAPGEEVETISAGDRSPWQIVPAGNRLFIRPMVEDVSTNMTILTNKHSYQFDLKSLAENKGGVVYVAKFIYPEPAPKASTALLPDEMNLSAEKPVLLAQTPAPALNRPAMTPAPMAPKPMPTPAPTPLTMSGPGITQPVNPNYNYTYTGPDEMAPIQVFDDGKSTYIRYTAGSGNLPEPYVVDASGKETAASYHMQGDAMVIDSISGQISLKGKNGTVTVYNEMLNPE